MLQQQEHALGRMTITDAEKQARIAMQKRINDAAITGKGLDGFTPAVRQQIDNVEFQSLLATDPAKLIARTRQPILVVQGDLDTGRAVKRRPHRRAREGPQAAAARRRREGARRQPSARAVGHG